MSKITEDPRIDPRIKAVFGAMDLAALGGGDVASREELLAESNSAEAQAGAAMMEQFLALSDTEEVAPSAGLTVQDLHFTSEPDGNQANIQFIRPDGDEPPPLRVLHPRRRHAVDVLHPRQLPRLGPHHRRLRGGSGHG